MASEQPDLFTYTNYRAYLRDISAYLKGSARKFSYRSFARAAGFSSPNYLQRVMQGERNLAYSSIGRIAKALGQDRAERSFFTSLVLMNQADSDEERDEHYQELSRARGYLRAKPIERRQYDYFSTWYLPPLRELISVDGFREDPAWIAKRMDPSITPGDAARGLELLERLGLIVRDANGRLQQSDSAVSTGAEVRSLAVRRYHTAMLDRARDAVSRLPLRERYAGGLTVAMSRGHARKIQKRLEELNDMLFEAMCGQEASEPRAAVYQLNLQFFPVTRPVGGREVGQGGASDDSE